MSHAKLIEFESAPLTDEERKFQTQMIMKLFILWNLTIKQQAIILGLSPNTGTGINKYKTGQQYLPQYRDIQDRIGYLFAIHQFLRQAYPTNKELAYQWMTTSNADFNHQTPFNMVAKEGFLGLARIKNYLELSLLS